VLGADGERVRSHGPPSTVGFDGDERGAVRHGLPVPGGKLRCHWHRG
jgi:hypothetical protein